MRMKAFILCLCALWVAGFDRSVGIAQGLSTLRVCIYVLNCIQILKKYFPFGDGFI